MLSMRRVHPAMRSAFRFVILVLVLLIVAMVSALTAMRFAIHGQEVAVPPLIGLTPQEEADVVAFLRTLSDGFFQP